MLVSTLVDCYARICTSRLVCLYKHKWDGGFRVVVGRGP